MDVLYHVQCPDLQSSHRRHASPGYGTSAHRDLSSRTCWRGSRAYLQSNSIPGSQIRDSVANLTYSVLFISPDPGRAGTATVPPFATIPEDSWPSTNDLKPDFGSA